MARRMLALLAAVAAVAGSIVARPGSADADARLRLRPNDGEPGELVTARGRGFAFGEAGDVSWELGGPALAEFVADDERIMAR